MTPAERLRKERDDAEIRSSSEQAGAEVEYLDAQIAAKKAEVVFLIAQREAIQKYADTMEKLLA